MSAACEDCYLHTTSKAARQQAARRKINVAKQRKFKDKILSKAELMELKVAEIVDIYNSVAAEPLKTQFKDKATAVDKTWKLGEAYEAPKAEKVAKEKTPRGPLQINMNARPAAERKSAIRDTAVDVAALKMATPEGASMEELMAATGKARNHVVGIIRWLGWDEVRERGMGWGIETLENGNYRIVDENREPLQYVQRADDAAAREARKAEREEKAKAKAAERQAKAEERQKARDAKKAEKESKKGEKAAPSAPNGKSEEEKAEETARLGSIKEQAEKRRAEKAAKPAKA